MPEALRNAPLRRRLLPPTPVRRASDSAIEKLIRVEFPRSADQLMALQADVQTVVFGRADHSAICDELTENDLICLMRRGADDVGLLTVDAALLAALIEVQTLGRVNSAPLKDRRPTRTDMVMVSDMLDRWMSDTSALSDEQGLARELLYHGFVRQVGILDLRAVRLSLDPGNYASMRITLALGGGARTGCLHFFVSTGARVGVQESKRTLGGKIRPHVLSANALMQVVLTRVEEPLERVLAFKTGDLVEIDPSSLANVRLEISGGRCVGRGRLGQMTGKRAIRLAACNTAAMEAATVKAVQLPSSLQSGGVEAMPSEALAIDDQSEEPSEMPEFSDDLPELPDMPGDLPDLPGLPDLPDLET